MYVTLGPSTRHINDVKQRCCRFQFSLCINRLEVTVVRSVSGWRYTDFISIVEPIFYSWYLLLMLQSVYWFWINSTTWLLLPYSILDDNMQFAERAIDFFCHVINIFLLWECRRHPLLSSVVGPTSGLSWGFRRADGLAANIGEAWSHECPCYM